MEQSGPGETDRRVTQRGRVEDTRVVDRHERHADPPPAFLLAEVRTWDPAQVSDSPIAGPALVVAKREDLDNSPGELSLAVAHWPRHSRGENGDEPSVCRGMNDSEGRER